MITKQEHDLYKNLMKLTDPKDQSKFYFRDYQTPFGGEYRIFSYNYASYSDWLLPDALECRGIMFEMVDGKPTRIAARPMEKFFNLDETPFTMNLDLTKIKLMMDKADGSLISSFVDNDQLFLKSKASISSEQAYAALQVINGPRYEKFLKRVTQLTKDGFTCNMEYVAPDNRIVLAYSKRDLILLNVRENKTGEYVPYEELFKDAMLRPHLVEAFNVPADERFVPGIRAKEGVEGYVFVMENGLNFKLKTDWYVALHRTKDSITKNEALFESVVSGGSDDLRSMFAGDEWAITKIDKFETIHLEFLRHALDLVQTTYKQLAGRDRKDFAISAQTIFKDADRSYLFPILMKAFTGGLDLDKLIPQLNEAFNKNHKFFVPDEYKKEIVIEQE
ncbi:RNA ligase and tail fiber protein attachment catalyst [Escherichia phage EcS1]|uniref:RNA ligase 1 n=1 Tax=Escherichia phage EcS1 TaxID=2083276 RepID=A0A2Z5ZCU1_9CAUD|nr:RNA ligase and tail fiber protein attachment catalyst [Escherichia phage EcS1]BBC78294.1 RNA ligase 1 and tail fiber attachment [Escherichia phage EcS1]